MKPCMIHPFACDGGGGQGRPGQARTGEANAGEETSLLCFIQQMQKDSGGYVNFTS